MPEQDFDFRISDEEAAGMDFQTSDNRAIRLPFAVPFFRWVNGDHRMIRAGGVAYTGGWGTDEQELLDAGQGWDPVYTAPPSYVGRDVIVTNDGKALPSFATRSMIVSVIGIRSCWTIGKFSKYKRWVPGASHRMQVFCYVADKIDGRLTPWNVAVLTVGGWGVDYFTKALDSWKQTVDKTVKSIGGNVPAWLFYGSFGNFGDPHYEMVGKSGSQSPITPITAQIPSPMDKTLLNKLYVGSQIKDMMLSYRAEADEWLHAWDNLPNDASGQPPADAAPQNGSYRNGNVPPEPEQPPDEDSLPF